MRGSNLLPKQLRSLGGNEGWLGQHVTTCLLSVASLACQHPIHTLVVIALLASTSYVGLLQESLFDTTAQSYTGQVDVQSLLDGGRTLELSGYTHWQWQVKNGHSTDGGKVSRCFILSQRHTKQCTAKSKLCSGNLCLSRIPDSTRAVC